MSKPAPSEAQQTLGVIKVSRESMSVLQERGIEAETVGLQRMSNGSALITLECVQDVKEKLRKEIRKDDGSDPMTLSANANALANIIKAETGLIKVLGGLPTAQETTKRTRKSFASVAPSAPIDVNPAN